MFTALFAGCQRQEPKPVRVHLPEETPFPTLQNAFLKPSAEVVAETGASISGIATPPLPESVVARRQIAIESIRQQRTAVREQLLATRLDILPQLEVRWRAEIESEYDRTSLLAEWDAEWFHAFQRYGRNRFLPLFETFYYPPNTQKHQQALTALAQLDQSFAQQEAQLEEALQARLDRIDQEIEVRLRARQREFVHETEQSVDQILASQPDLSELYLPPLEPLPPAPIIKIRFPPSAMQFPAENLNNAVMDKIAGLQRVRAQILKQLAQEWAQVHGYQLVDSPTAPDVTEAFQHYLSFR